MGIIKTFFFDTYALYEIIEGNPNYILYTKNIAIITTKLNLMELHYGLLSRYGKEIAEKYYNELVKFSIPINDEIIKMANEFKHSFKIKKFSYIDCIGYVTSKLRGVKFLTGDNQFKDMENVEFVK